MRKLLLVCLLGVTLFALSARELKLQIIRTLASLYTPKEHPVIYLESLPEEAIREQRAFVVDCRRADVLFVEDIDRFLQRCPIRKGQILFTLSYHDYIAHKERAAGAFFWQKGRPNIVLNKALLKRLGIELPPKYDKYVE